MNRKLLMLMVALFAYINPAFAYQANEIGTEHQYKESDVVLIGTVTDIYIDNRTGDPCANIKSELKIKGSVKGDFALVMRNGVSEFDVDKYLQKGHKYLIFLRKIRDGMYETTLGKYSIFVSVA